MNLRMTQYARLEKARLIVERRRSGRSAEARLRVALQAQQVDVAQFQHVRIWAAVRQMARLASIRLHRLVLEYKWPLLIRVALEANRVLCGGSSHLFRFHRPVRIVTVAALDQALIHAVVKWHIELCFLLEMARVTKLGLRLYEQELRLLRVMR
jgi:hypothetical protein